MASGPCRECASFGRCAAPCQRLLARLNSPDEGRLPEGLRARGQAEIDQLLTFAPFLEPKTDAIVHLYYRSSFTMERIGRDLGLSRAAVSRRILTAWRQFARGRTTPGAH